MEIPQRFILRLFLFLIYINGLTTIADYSTVRMYADDTNMTLTACSSSEVLRDVTMDLQFLQNWLIGRRLALNDLKTESMLARSGQKKATLTQELDLFINGISLKSVNGSKCFGVKIDEFLTWNNYHYHSRLILHIL